MERPVGKNEKLECFKLKSWKVSEVGKFLFKLERGKRGWKEPTEVGKNRAKLEIIERTFQLHKLLCNFRPSFSTSARTFQLQLELSNFSSNFPTSARTFQLQFFQFRFGLSNLTLSKFSFFPTVLCNYMYPRFTVQVKTDFLKK